MLWALTILFGAGFFAAAGALGVAIGNAFAQRLPRFDDGPAPHTAPIPVLVAGCAIIGAIVTAMAPTREVVLVDAVVCTALAGIWITDARVGLVPDALTLGPLALLVTLALLQHDWRIFFLIGLLVTPFAMMAALSRGRGMGWGDVKLAALGAAVLNLPVAIVCFCAACFAAAIVHLVQGKRRGLIAFAPYLATAIGAGIPAILFVKW
jgi:prepilin signal peptidase PulO-like enzyme (type II secretory pathway)